MEEGLREWEKPELEALKFYLVLNILTNIVDVDVDQGPEPRSRLHRSH
jgi:hypothetical protein